MIDKIKAKLDNAIIVLVSAIENKIVFVIGVSKSLSKDYNASSLLNTFATFVEGKGGGRNDIARGSGTNTKGIQQGIQAVKNTISTS